jgi:hypothetical protein
MSGHCLGTFKAGKCVFPAPTCSVSHYLLPNFVFSLSLSSGFRALNSVSIFDRMLDLDIKTKRQREAA